MSASEGEFSCPACAVDPTSREVGGALPDELRTILAGDEPVCADHEKRRQLRRRLARLTPMQRLVLLAELFGGGR